MSEKTFNMIFKVVTGLVMVAEGVCGYLIQNDGIRTAVLAGIPLVGNCIIGVCKNFVKPELPAETK